MLTNLWKAKFTSGSEKRTVRVTGHSPEEALETLRESLQWKSERYTFVSLKKIGLVRIAEKPPEDLGKT